MIMLGLSGYLYSARKNMTTITLEVPDELAGRLASLQTHLPQLLTFPMRRVHGSADLQTFAASGFPAGINPAPDFGVSLSNGD